MKTHPKETRNPYRIRVKVNNLTDASPLRSTIVPLTNCWYKITNGRQRVTQTTHNASKLLSQPGTFQHYLQLGCPANWKWMGFHAGAGKTIRIINCLLVLLSYFFASCCQIFSIFFHKCIRLITNPSFPYYLSSPSITKIHINVWFIVALRCLISLCVRLGRLGCIWYFVEVHLL